MHFPRSKLIFIATCAIALIANTGAALPYPILAPLFVDVAPNGFNHFWGIEPKFLFGLALAVNPIGILIGSMVLGLLSDRLGRRPLIMLTLWLALGMQLLAAWALSIQNYPLFLLARLALGFSEGNIAVARAIVADVADELPSGRAFAWFNTAAYGGWMLGPLIGGFGALWGVPAPFLLAAAATLLCLALTIACLPATVASAPQAASQSGSLRQLRQLLGVTEVRKVFLIQLAFTLGVTTYYEFSPMWLSEFMRHSPAQIGVVIALQCLIMTLTSANVAPDVQRLSAFTRRHATWFALGMLAFALMPSWPGVALMLLIAMPLASYSAAMHALCAQRFAEHGNGAVMGLLSSVFAVANLLVALVGGAVSMLDTRLVIGLGALACLGAAFALRKLEQGEQQLLSLASP